MRRFQGASDQKKECVQRIRFYLFRTGGVDIALSECYFGSEKRTVDMSYEEAVEQAYTRALLFTGSDNMKGSIAAVLQKAQNGEKITVAMLGDSITAGAGAGVGRAWVDQVGNWLEKLDGDESNRNVTVINAGIGSTEAVLGVSRIAKDVLAYTPDLVIVDFGTNDYGLLYGAEAYEGILTKLICAGIPVINSNVCPRNGNTIQSQQIPINANYGVPQVSFREAYYELSRVTDIVGLRANDIWTSDHVHPSTAGHTLLANLLIKYMQREIFDKHIAPAALDTTLPTPITKNGFKDAELIENDSENDHICVTMDDGWTADYQAEFFQFQANGWQTSTVGATITFTVSAGYFYLMNSMTANAGTVELKVDGKRLQSLNCNVSDRYMNVFHVFHFAEPGEYTVTVTTVDNPNVENDWFGICSVGIANFDGYNEDTDSTKTVLFDGTNSTGMWGDGEIAVQTVDNVVAVSRTSVGKATPAEPYDVIFCGILGPINASALAEQDEAYVNLRIYISDVSKVLDGTTAGVLELSSEGSLFDGVVLWSQIVNRSFVNGWNTVQLKLSEATKTGTTAFDASKINLFRFYIRTTGDIKVALADCYISNGAAEGPVYPTTLFNGADTTGMWGDGTITVETIADTTGIFRDSVGAASQTVPYDVIFCGLLPAVNASKNAANEDAYVNLKIYISDVSKVLKGMTGGVLEISSEGSLTDGVLVWYEIVDDSFVNGWNTVKLKLNTASTAGDIPFDASKINLFRFYIRTTGDVKIGLADCLVTFE